MLVIGADLGGTGARAALAQDAHVITETRLEGVTDRVRAVELLVKELMAQTGLSKVDALAVGATGFAMLGAPLRHAATGFPARRVLLCSDMVSSYAGALGFESGAVVAAGTGAVALGFDGDGIWRRVDGWGHLLGDLGGGSWIGRTALQAALRSADGRPSGSPALLAALRKHFGSPTDLVASLNARDDRAGMMASFVPSVVEADDEVARAILAQAGALLAETALAALVGKRVVATTGNLFRVTPVREAFEAALEGQAELVRAKGSSMDGAVLLAAAAIKDELPPGLPCEQFTAPT
jgi:N-acetylglucosamine kinase-like BadF-type ATPase